MLVLCVVHGIVAGVGARCVPTLVVHVACDVQVVGVVYAVYGCCGCSITARV